jgi:hypothetical protein
MDETAITEHRYRADYERRLKLQLFSVMEIRRWRL